MDNTRALFLPSRGSDFWKLERYTERTLYDLILEQVRRPKAIRGERPDDTFERLQRVLGAFEFLGGQTEDVVRTRIDRELLAFVDSPNDLARVRERMLGDLLERARKREVISQKTFFAHHDLKGVALTKWTRLRDRARELLADSSGRWSHETGREARPDLVCKTLDAWADDMPVMILYGKSGHGKTWLAYSLAEAVLAHDRDLALMTPSQGDADKTLEDTARRVWRDVCGRSTAKPSLALIADHVRGVLERPNCRWLTLVIDDVQDKKEARCLLEAPWASWGIRVAITCQTQVYEALTVDLASTIWQTNVGPFTDRELVLYLQGILGDHWTAMEEDVRNPLRTPIIADTFRQVVAKRGDKKWQPQSEYEVFQQHWRELEYEDGGIAAIEPLVRMAIDGAKYPWSDLQLKKAGVTPGEIRLLKKARWLHATTEGNRKLYAVPHERLLSWAVAEILVSDLSHDSIKPTQLGEKLRSYLSGKLEPGRLWLGYVAMDALWIAVVQENLNSKIGSVIEAMEPSQHDLDIFYERLIPTIGKNIVPFLTDRLRKVHNDQILQIYIRNAMVRIC